MGTYNLQMGHISSSVHNLDLFVTQDHSHLVLLQVGFLSSPFWEASKVKVMTAAIVLFLYDSTHCSIFAVHSWKGIFIIVLHRIMQSILMCTFLKQIYLVSLEKNYENFRIGDGEDVKCYKLNYGSKWNGYKKLGENILRILWLEMIQLEQVLI